MAHLISVSTGLMGNFNADPTDDAILSDGTNLGDPNGYTEEQLYTQFGLPCKKLALLYYIYFR